MAWSVIVNPTPKRRSARHTFGSSVGIGLSGNFPIRDGLGRNVTPRWGFSGGQGSLQGRTIIPGASEIFIAGWIVYSNRAKSEFLNLEPATIDRHGAVSEEVACELAANARAVSTADYALSVTGIAGPSGATAAKPVGLVYIGLADSAGVEVRRNVFSGDRSILRRRAAYTAMDMLRIKLL